MRRKRQGQKWEQKLLLRRGIFDHELTQNCMVAPFTTFLQSLKILVSSAVMLLMVTQLSAQDMDAGKALFKANCGSCHNKNMKADMTGPALGGVQERWSEYPEDLYRWIRNSQALVNEGQPEAVEIYEAWNGAAMTAFPELTDSDIDNILAYVDGVYTGTYGPAPAAGDIAGADGSQQAGTPNYLYYVLFGMLLVLALVLGRVIANLNYMVQAKEGSAPMRRKSLFEILLSKRVIGFVLFALVLFGAYTMVNNAISLGRQQGYAPEQPIKFSHETHAGINKIDCQYCHDGARRSKHSVIPAANTCMNCHKAIKVGSEYGTQELTKIFASTGYNPNTDTYLENPESVSHDSLKAIYTQWIGDQYLVAESKEEIDGFGENLIDEQWDEIVSSLTNPTKDHIYGPIEWVRIHNLPDHVYFNHAQHVSVGEIECQQCHGKVEEMEVLAQHSPLSMGWCINCHRESEVNFKDNEYYASYTRYHDEIKNGERSSVTVEDIGGLECQKCHY